MRAENFWRLAGIKTNDHIPDYPDVPSERDKVANFNEMFSSLVEAVKSTLDSGDEVYTRKPRGLIAWKRHQGVDMGLRLGSDHSLLYFCWVTYYNSFTFRLRGGYSGVNDLRRANSAS
jgi:hypothetical protein